MYTKIIEELKGLAEPTFREWLRPFLSIHDDSNEILLGVRIPHLRKLAKRYQNVDLKNLKKLLQNNIHESRALAIFIMILKSKMEPDSMCELYLQNLKYINNWDLIDYSAPHIVAPNTSKETLRNLAASDYLWANRVAIVSTIYYIKQKDYKLTLEFAKKYINHNHHLIHKATGWMLREIGKQDIKILKDFLNKYSETMPAIMRSYAKEKLK